MALGGAMWGLIVVLGLVAVVILVGVLVALGMRSSRSSDDDDWMSDEDQQPRGRRGGRSRGRRGHDDDLEDEPYGDMRVAGAPQSHGQLPAAPVAGSGAAPALPPPHSAPVPPRGAAPSGRSSDEMDDDEYWSTITFDKPKFPWRQNGEQQGEPRGNDPLAPSRAHGHGQGHGPGQQPAPPTVESLPVGPIDTPAPPTAPQPAIPSNPLDAPVGRSGGDTDPGSVPSFGSPSPEQSGGFGPYSGDQPSHQAPQQSSPYGDD